LKRAAAWPPRYFLISWPSFPRSAARYFSSTTVASATGSVEGTGWGPASPAASSADASLSPSSAPEEGVVPDLSSGRFGVAVVTLSLARLPVLFQA